MVAPDGYGARCGAAALVISSSPAEAIDIDHAIVAPHVGPAVFAAALDDNVSCVMQRSLEYWIHGYIDKRMW